MVYDICNDDEATAKIHLGGLHYSVLSKIGLGNQPNMITFGPFALEI